MAKSEVIRAPKQPKYRKHKSSGQAIVTLPDGLGRRRDVLLGQYGTSASHNAYDRVIAEWLMNGRRLSTIRPEPTTGLTINELILQFWRKAEFEGRSKLWLDEFKYALRPLKQLYGEVQAVQFGPLALEVLRDRMVESGLCRGIVNRRVGFIRRVFKFGVAKELFPPSVHQALMTVEGLVYGLTKARETEPVRPVPHACVEAIKPFVCRHIWGLIQVQLLTGCRPTEACLMRTCDLDMSGPVWLYTLEKHKTAYRGKKRVIAIGPKAQAVIREFFTTNAEDFLFSPQRAMAERSVILRISRKSKVQPSQLDRRTPNRKRAPGDHYTARSLAKAIARGCELVDAKLRAEATEAAKAAGKEPPAPDIVFFRRWGPNRLRHSHATEVRKRFGLEAAGATLGHSKLSTTEIYAEKNAELAQRVAAEVG